MTWHRSDDGFPEHPKSDALAAHFGDDWATCAVAFMAWHHMGCDCAARRTDGVFSAPRAYRVVRAPRVVIDRALEGLLKVGFLDKHRDGYVFHDWSEYQPTRAELDAERAAKTERQQRWRKNLRGKAASVDGAVDASTPRRVDGAVDASVDGGVDGAPSRPDPTTSQSTPNGVLPAQRGDRATPDAKSKPSKADAPPPPPGTPAAAVVEAIGRSVLAGLVRYPHRFAAAQVAAYPSIDLPLQIAQASAWCVANPQHAPRADGARFLGAWLKRSHDRATSAAASQAQRVDGRHPTPSLFDGPRPVPARRVVVGESERELREYLNTHGASRD